MGNLTVGVEVDSNSLESLKEDVELLGGKLQEAQDIIERISNKDIEVTVQPRPSQR